MNQNRAVRVLAAIIAGMFLTGCTTMCATLTVNLVQRRTDASWDVSFDAMNGYLSTTFNNIDESGCVLNYQITYGEGEIIVRLRQGSRSQELSMAESSISLDGWDLGNIIIELNSKAARYAKLSFSWGDADNGGGTGA